MSQKTLTSKKTPPITKVKSPQYDLFSRFISNEDSEVSNTVEFWESIPKYFFTSTQVETLRTETGHADPYKWEYDHYGTSYTVKIQPALIEQDDGTYLAFFPGATEEFIEEALKKIFSDQQYGFHDPKNMESWVQFTLNMIKKELKARGRTRSINEIKQAIEVMSLCIISLYQEGEEVWKGAILQDLTTVGRKEYLANTETYHVARLPLFISHGIQNLEYRQFNYNRLMSCNEQLTRWIYKQLIHRFKQASITTDYHFKYSDLVKNSGLLQQSNERRNRAKVISALNELIKREVLKSFDPKPKKNGQKIVDVIYNVIAAREFIKEQKAANKRVTDNTKALNKTN